MTIYLEKNIIKRKYSNVKENSIKRDSNLYYYYNNKKNKYYNVGFRR